MNQIQEIIENYSAADEELRLSMFLTYRDLRPQFTEIDMAGLKARMNASSKRAGELDVDFWPFGIARNCWGWFKHCWSAK